jgi:tRNA1(Val) A37 N6-methylase TrmN6
MRAHKIEPKKILTVYSRNTEYAELCLVKGIKDGGKELFFDPPFFIYGKTNKYTKKMEHVFKKLSISKTH